MIKSKNLPQISAPFTYIIDHLDYNNIGYTTGYVKPSECKITQSFIDSDTIDFFKDNEVIAKKPIVLAMDNDVIDGNHRVAYDMMYQDKQPIRMLRIMLGLGDAVNILNQIEDNWAIEKNNYEDKSVILKGYRSKPLPLDSKSGIFLNVNKKSETDNNYEIKFNNLLKIHSKNLKDCGTLPTLYLAKKLFSNDQIKKDSILKNLKYETYVNRLAHDYAKSKGYDGVLYGNEIIQLINT